MKCLEEIAENDATSGAQADILSKSVCTFDFVFNLIVLSHIFSTANILSKYLQSTCISIYHAFEKVEAVQQSMLDLRTEQECDRFWKEASDICSKLGFDDPVLPRRRKVPARLEGGSIGATYTDVKHFYLVTFFYPIIDVISARMEERFHENDLAIMEKLLTAENFASIPDNSIYSMAFLYNLNSDDLKAELRVFCNLVEDREAIQSTKACDTR